MVDRKPTAKRTAKRTAKKATPRKQRRLAAVPDVFDPPYEAWKLRQRGVAWHEVARQTGYSSARVARLAVGTFLQQGASERAEEQRAEALQLSIDRYEALINAYWDQAITERSTEAATVILRAMGQSDRVQRLGSENDEVVVPRTIVIAGTPEAYVAKLKAVVEGGDPDAIPEDYRPPPAKKAPAKKVAKKLAKTVPAPKE